MFLYNKMFGVKINLSLTEMYVLISYTFTNLYAFPTWRKKIGCDSYVFNLLYPSTPKLAAITHKFIATTTSNGNLNYLRFISREVVSTTNLMVEASIRIVTTNNLT